MVKHVKPTKEELEANAQKALEEAENLKQKETEELPPEENEDIKPEEKDEEVIEDTEDTEKENNQDNEEEDTKPDIDYKKKFTESTREAQILYARNKKMAEAIDNSTSIPEPTEEELKKKYPDWEVMGEFEKQIAKDNLINNKRFESLSVVTKDFKDIENWQKKIDSFIEDPKSLIKYPQLEGKEDEFKIFSMKTTRRGIDFEDLVPAFLYNAEETKPKSKKGKMFETGSAGPNDRMKPKSNKITIDQARALRKSDYNKYREYVKAGKIEEV